MENFWQIFWTAIGIVLSGLATWLTTTVVGWLNSKIKDKNLARCAEDLWKIVMNAVQRITQTYVDTLKKNGTFNEEAQKEAFSKCEKIILSQLTSELLDYIKTNFGDVQAYIKTLIESCLFQVKHN